MIRIRKLLLRLMARFPGELPRGMEALDKFVSDLTATYDLPNNPSYQHMIATMIQHLPQESRFLKSPVHKVSKHHFFKAIKRAEATETAFWKIRQIKLDEKKALEAKQAATPSTEPQLDGSEAAQGPTG